MASSYPANRDQPRPPLHALVLAAGEGTRMRSQRPKPLHRLCGRPMVLYVLDALLGADPDGVSVVVGHGAEWVTKTLQQDGPDLLLTFVEQRIPRGTGDAVLVGLTGLPEDDMSDGDVLVLPGDVPLLRPGTVAAFVEHHRESGAACSVLTAPVPPDDAADRPLYGRIVRDRRGRVRAIDRTGWSIGAFDGSADLAAGAGEDADLPGEASTGIFCFSRSVIAPALRRLSPEHGIGEYDVTDAVAVLADAGYLVESLELAEAGEAVGVNDRVQLAAAEAELRHRTNLAWMQRGVTMVDPERTYVDVTVRLANDVTLFPGTVLQGQTVVGAGAELGPDTRLVDCAVGRGAVVETSNGRDAEVGEDARVGPYAVLLPGSQIAAGQVTGPFYTATN